MKINNVYEFVELFADENELRLFRKALRNYTELIINNCIKEGDKYIKENGTFDYDSFLNDIKE
jgi:hypothetical protein